MIEPASIESLKAAVEGMHGGTATFVQAVPVREEFEGRLGGVVHVFDMVHSLATKAYAWSSPVEGSNKRRIFAVLQRPINTPPMPPRAIVWNTEGIVFGAWQWIAHSDTYRWQPGTRRG